MIFPRRNIGGNSDQYILIFSKNSFEELCLNDIDDILLMKNKLTNLKIASKEFKIVTIDILIF